MPFLLALALAFLLALALALSRFRFAASGSLVSREDYENFPTSRRRSAPERPRRDARRSP